MTLQSTYVYTCDSNNCAGTSPPQDNNWQPAPGWSQLNVQKDGRAIGENRVLHFCPKCTGAIIDGFLKLQEDE